MYNKTSKLVMESTNVVFDDQGIVSKTIRLDESKTEGPLHASRDDASTNDATPGNGSSPNTKDASLFTESLSQPEDLTTNSMGYNREASTQV